MARILIVDDEDDMRELLGILARDASGHSFIGAENGRDALEIYRNETIDLVVTDLNMPGGHGFGLIDALLSEDPGVKIIAMSGFGLDLLEEARALGVRRIVEKPFRYSMMRGLIEETLREAS